jgi:branched-subunit amino acid aminotransferase/4-amino-4-deoxychorismate lyase
VLEGEPVELDAHLSRLAGSLDDLYGEGLARETEMNLRREAKRLRLGRLRLTAVPTGGGLRIDLLAGEIDPEVVFPAEGVRLRRHSVPGGLGAHKWVQRPGINRPGPDGAGALIVDEGEVLEAGWANVFAIRGGTLFTPPLDDRLLPGTTRAALLALACQEGVDAREQPLAIDDLLTAEETFLTGSIRGIEPAVELDGQPLTGCGEITRRLAAALRQRWGLPELQAAATAQKPDQPSR